MRRIKRLFDLEVAVPSVIILSPVLVLIGILVRFKIGSPVIFRQVRPGLHGKPFTIYKFRTMTDERDKDGNLLADGERLTPFGAFLRRTSLDELPELVNVFKGDMSIVGPRHGEKLYETLLDSEEMATAQDLGVYYRIPIDVRDLNYNKYFVEDEKQISGKEDYTSNNMRILNVEEIKEVLLKVGYIQDELSHE